MKKTKIFAFVLLVGVLCTYIVTALVDSLSRLIDGNATALWHP